MEGVISRSFPHLSNCQSISTVQIIYRAKLIEIAMTALLNSLTGLNLFLLVCVSRYQVQPTTSGETSKVTITLVVNAAPLAADDAPLVVDAAPLVRYPLLRRQPHAAGCGSAYWIDTPEKIYDSPPR